MKTIKDAYEELKGDLNNCKRDWRNGDIGLWFNKYENVYLTQQTKNPSDSTYHYKYICTVEEFNNYKSDDKPVYTQAMCDAGELPSVGMDIVVRYMHDSKTVTHTGCVLFISECRVIIGNGTGDHHHLLGDYRCEPLTPPIKLMEGKAYQFCFGGDVRQGFYGNGFLVDIEGSQMIEYCTNIVALVVKG